MQGGPWERLKSGRGRCHLVGGRRLPASPELWLRARRGAFSRENSATYISCVFCFDVISLTRY